MGGGEWRHEHCDDDDVAMWRIAGAAGAGCGPSIGGSIRVTACVAFPWSARALRMRSYGR